MHLPQRVGPVVTVGATGAGDQPGTFLSSTVENMRGCSPDNQSRSSPCLLRMHFGRQTPRRRHPLLRVETLNCPSPSCPPPPLVPMVLWNSFCPHLLLLLLCWPQSPPPSNVARCVCTQYSAQTQIVLYVARSPADGQNHQLSEQGLCTCIIRAHNEN